MSKKTDIIDKLTAAGIEHDASATIAELEVLLPEEEETTTGSETIAGIEVRDPEALKPKTLPLVIPAPEGGWANDAQVEYAKFLNAYAYKNPEKWALKKADRTEVDTKGNQSVVEGLVSKLAKLGKQPSLLRVYMGLGPDTPQGRLEYHNKRTQA